MTPHRMRSGNRVGEREALSHGSTLAAARASFATALLRQAAARSVNVRAVAETKRPTSPGGRRDPRALLPGARPRLRRRWSTTWAPTSASSARRASATATARASRALTRGLLRYLRRHKHTTPSEMVELKFHCCMPMFIARQWIRHRTANVNEYSGTLLADADAVLHAGRGAAADAEQAQQPGAQRPGGRARALRRGAAALERRSGARAPTPTTG